MASKSVEARPGNRSAVPPPPSAADDSVQELRKRQSAISTVFACMIVLVLTLGALCSVLLFFVAQESESDSIRREFRLLAGNTASAVSQSIDSYLEAQAQVSMALSISNDSYFDPQEWLRQTKFLRAIRPGLNSLALTTRVRQDRRGSYEAVVQGGVPIVVVSKTTGTPVPAPTDTEELWPLSHSVLRPEAQSTSMDGIDLLSIPPVFDIIMNAAQSGVCQTGKYVSAVDGLRLLGSLCAVYDPTLPPPYESHPAEALNAATYGATIVTIRTDDLVATSLFASLPEDTVALLEDLTIDNETDFGSASGVVLLLNDPSSTVAAIANDHGVVTNMDADEYHSITRDLELRVHHDVAFGNRVFRMYIVGLSDFSRSRETSNPYFVLVAGLAVSCFLAVGIFVTGAFVRARDRGQAAEVIMEERAKRLMAQAAKEAHEKTLGYTCHELRNPLHAISASADFLLEVVQPGDDGYEDLQAILTGSQQMHRLVNDVLDWGKLRAGKLTLSPVEFDLRSTLHEIVSLHQGMCNPNVRLRAYVDDGVPQLVVLDNLRIRQLVSNGLTNALKLTRRGHIVVRVSVGEMLVPEVAAGRRSVSALFDSTNVQTSCTDIHAAGSVSDPALQAAAQAVASAPPVSSRCLIFEVADTGPGLRGIDPSQLFEPYAQGRKAATSPTARRTPNSQPRSLEGSRPRVPSRPSSLVMGADGHMVCSRSSSLPGAVPTPGSPQATHSESKAMQPQPPGSMPMSTPPPQQRVLRPSVSTAYSRMVGGTSRHGGGGDDTGRAGNSGDKRRRAAPSQPQIHAKTGTGLGLPICKQLVTLMHGEIGLVERYPEPSSTLTQLLWPNRPRSAASSPHSLRATVFWFSVPVSDDVAVSLEEPNLSPQSAAVSHFASSSGGGRDAGAGTSPPTASRVRPSGPSSTPSPPTPTASTTSHSFASPSFTEMMSLELPAGSTSPSRRPPHTATQQAFSPPESPVAGAVVCPAASAAVYAVDPDEGVGPASLPSSPAVTAAADPGLAAPMSPGGHILSSSSGLVRLTSRLVPPPSRAARSPAVAAVASSLAAAAVSAPATSTSVSTPVSSSVIAPSMASPAPPRALQRSGSRRQSLSLRCIIVDDELVNRRVCSRMLKKMGCTVLALEDGDQLEPALRSAGYGGAATFTPYDVILLDIMMERTNGIEVMEDLVAKFTPTNPTPLPPCVAVTGNTSMQDVASYISAGFVDVLSKPFNMESLRTLLVRVVSAHGSRLESLTPRGDA